MLYQPWNRMAIEITNAKCSTTITRILMFIHVHLYI